MQTKATLYAELDSLSKPKSIAVTGQSKTKKNRHRRVGSGTITSPKSSPSRDRRYQSEPENRVVKKVDIETQTDDMEISETDGSPSPYLAALELSLCLREQQKIQKNSSQITERLTIKEIIKTDGSPTSPNGNTMSTSDITYHDACSSPDLIDDAMNSNDRLEIRECSDDDHLETFGRKVSEFITVNCLSVQSGQSENLVNGNRIDPDMILYTVGRKRNLVGETDISSLNRSSQRSREKDKIESRNDQCEDSWTDEEGEDPCNYNYTLRRKR